MTQDEFDKIMQASSSIPFKTSFATMYGTNNDKLAIIIDVPAKDFLDHEYQCPHGLNARIADTNGTP